MKKLPVILLMGPTASGKTACAMEMGRHFPIEIVSVDSALVYRDMNIGTAKPTSVELSACPHHLIDIISPEEVFSAARFRETALDLVRQIHARNHLPVLAGGTMLYFKALREGLSDLPQASPDLRRAIEAEAARSGWPAMHRQLHMLDPEAAARLNPNDSQRIQRALEIVRMTGEPLTVSYARKGYSAEAEQIRYLTLALGPADRKVLHERIAERFDAMLAAGFEQEVRSLRVKYQLTPQMTSMRCVGYRQMWDYLDGCFDLETLREKGIAATRQLAKRQLTWQRQFRENWRDFNEFDCLAPDHQSRICHALAGWLKSSED